MNQYRTIGSVIALSVCLLFGAPTVHAAVGEHITAYDVDIVVHEDATLDVVETITYDFGDNQRHGIYREIPLVGEVYGERKAIAIDDVRVMMDDVAADAHIRNEGGELYVRIGDADAFVSGQKTYTISYTVRGAIVYGDSVDELYWNAIGTQWDVPIRRARVTVTMPTDVV